MANLHRSLLGLLLPGLIWLLVAPTEVHAKPSSAPQSFQESVQLSEGRSSGTRPTMTVTVTVAGPEVQSSDTRPSTTITSTDPVSSTVFLPFVRRFAHVFLPMAGTRTPFSNPWPSFNAERRSLNSYLTWEFDRGEPVTYTVYLEAGNPDPGAVIATGLAEPRFDPYTFETDTTYYWRVEATLPDGSVVGGPTWKFSTDYFPYPPETDAMIDVPAGEFLMGCDPANSGYTCLSNQVPLHAVYVEAFRLDKYEVTNAEYRACVHAGACNPPKVNGTKNRIESYFDNEVYNFYPVMFVSHWDAENFCSWEGKRLPTEAEWEKAARGAIDTRPWPWGNEDWDCTRVNRCNWVSARVDEFYTNQSPYGAVNMSGNVFEWVQDFFYDYYYYDSPYYNPINLVQPQEIPYFSIRGGSYHDNWWYARTSHRSGGHRGGDEKGDKPGEDAPLFRTFRVGFRCAAAAD